MHRLRALALIVPLVLGSGCFNTRVVTGAPSDGIMHNARQWFTVGGLVPLSDPAGPECADRGLARAESRLDVVDALISIGIGVAGGLLGVAVCPLGANPTTDDARSYGSCVGGVSALAGFLIGSRSVEYQCTAR